jgi:hypothetical protein
MFARFFNGMLKRRQFCQCGMIILVSLFHNQTNSNLGPILALDYNPRTSEFVSGGITNELIIHSENDEPPILEKDQG